MPVETIKDRIDQDKNNFVDTNEINKFIFNENEGDKNLNDLGEYLNKLPTYLIANNDQVKNAIKNGLNNYQEWKEMKKDITKKIDMNAPLTKKELSLVYLDMLSDDNFRKNWPISNEELKFDASKPIDQICNGKLVQFIRQRYLKLIYTGTNLGESGKEKEQKGGDKVSENMFQELLTMESSQNFVAIMHKGKFGENFVTGPYGMVYKLIDSKGNPLKTPTEFKEGEKSNPEWAKQNAKVYYNNRAQEWKNLLDNKGYEYNQAQLDSLVSASGGTKKSVERLQNFVLSHREQPTEVSNFMSTFATKSQNGQVQPGLVIRRQFESNWFMGIKKSFTEYQKDYYNEHPQKPKQKPKQKPRRKK